ncbi:MAG: short-chain dehydrogenase/reductase [Ilumatobacteraceae bacterium]|jgi:3-oxoacyl-[acyl-carrier protein] reductase|nr:short-chain dehydrogenase/reductase [Ilumatobacteraceae bacterium]
MDLHLSGRRAAVAAATAGLGLASAKALAAEGVRVAICGRTQDRVDAAVAQIGGDAVGFPCDVSTPDGGRSFVEQAIAALGGVDILVPNGGGPPPGNFASTDFALYQPALNHNLLSIVAMCQAAVPAMRAQHWGRIVAITSLAVRQPMPTLILSNTARAGVTAFLKTLATEIAGDGVTVNSVQPGTHLTDRIRSVTGADTSAAARGVPAGIIGDPDDFGSVVAFLCSESAKFMTGVQVHVDGGAFAGLQ